MSQIMQAKGTEAGSVAYPLPHALEVDNVAAVAFADNDVRVACDPRQAGQERRRRCVEDDGLFARLAVREEQESRSRSTCSQRSVRISSRRAPVIMRSRIAAMAKGLALASAAVKASPKRRNSTSDRKRSRFCSRKRSSPLIGFEPRGR